MIPRRSDADWRHVVTFGGWDGTKAGWEVLVANQRTNERCVELGLGIRDHHERLPFPQGGSHDNSQQLPIVEDAQLKLGRTAVFEAAARTCAERSLMASRLWKAFWSRLFPRSAPPLPKEMDDSLLDVLACPLSKQRLRALPGKTGSSQRFVAADVIGRKFPVVNGIVDLRVDQALPIDS